MMRVLFLVCGLLAAASCATAETPAVLDRLVVGAGFTGLYTAYQLSLDGGVDFLVVESSSGLGGTWNFNRYPGAACDIDSVEYSFSTAEIRATTAWSQRLSGQAELLAYLESFARTFDLTRRVRFNTRIARLDWLDDEQLWQATAADSGELFLARHVLLAVGCLAAAPKQPDIAGLDNFRGTILRTSSWPADAPDLSDKRVAIVGTGSSGVQSIPQLARLAKHLTVFQRTPGWVLPAGNHAYDAQSWQQAEAGWPLLRAIAQVHPFGLGGLQQGMKTFADVDRDELLAEFERRWQTGGFLQIGVLLDLVLNIEADAVFRQFIAGKIAQIVDDEVTRADLTPDIPFGCKRPLLGSNYYETFNRDNVQLVNLRRTPFAEWRPHSVVTADGVEHPVDVLVLAIGFDALTGPILNIDIKGRHAQSLRDKWAEHGPSTYLGLQTRGFPNLYFLANLHSPSVLTNMVYSIEQHVNYTTQMTRWLDDHHVRTCEPTAEAEQQWTQLVQTVGSMTLFGSDHCKAVGNWYRGSNIDGKGDHFLPFVGADMYAARCKAVAEAGYEGFELQPEPSGGSVLDAAQPLLS